MCSYVTIDLKLSHYQNSINMKNKNYERCPIARSLAFSGDSWCVLILRDAHSGATRFDEFRKNLRISPTILTRRLALLTEEGVLEKRLYSEHPPREEYLLTDAGREFLPILFAIGAWGRKYRAGGELTRFFDAELGSEIVPVMIDEITGAKIGSRPIRIEQPE
jgi:DNA-binding HxlR family transcriptional regulator